MICWGVAEVSERNRIPTAALAALSAAILVSLAVVARQQVNLWQVEEALWEQTIEHTGRNWIAESQLGAALAMHGNIAESMQHFNAALQIAPDDGKSNLAVAMYDLQQGNFVQALSHYKVAVAQPVMRPEARIDAYIGMAKAYRALGDHEKSAECLAKAKTVSAQ
jgi:tetratricopeptide (TPR) repeat protein